MPDFTVETPLTPTNGGTGKSTFTQHSIVKGGASNAHTEIAVGSNNDVFRRRGLSRRM